MLGEPIRVAAADFSVRDIPVGVRQRLRLVIDRLPDGQDLAIAGPGRARVQALGKTLLVTGAVHGDEYEGPIAIQDVFAELGSGETMRGTFVGVPVTNGPAFSVATREGAWDHQNLARIFPGRRDGTPSERIAHAYVTHLLPQVDLLLDMHSGGKRDTRCTRLPGYQTAPRVIWDASSALRRSPSAWTSSGAPVGCPGRSLSAAGERGLPAIYVEMPGEGRCRP